MSNRKIIEYLMVFFTICIVGNFVYQTYEDTRPKLDPSTKQFLLESTQREIKFQESSQISWQRDCNAGKQEECQWILKSKLKVEDLKKKLKDIENQ